MKKRTAWWLATGIVALAVLGIHIASAQQQEELNPLIVNKDTDHLVFENMLVRVTEERVPPGVTQPKHAHQHGVTVSLSDYDIDQTTYPDNKTVHRHTDFGTVRWSEAIIHQTTNTSHVEQRVVRIELKY
jgi:hypothetical protein